MEYKAYNGGKRYKVYNGDTLYVLNMYKPLLACSVETGGDITLWNGDILHINEKMGVFDPWDSGDDYEGISFTLESGHQNIAYFLRPNANTWPYYIETGYGCFYDYSESVLYQEGNIIKIYDVDEENIYDIPEVFWAENYMSYYGIPLIGVIAIENGNWVLKSPNNTVYAGTTLTLASGEEIYISGISMCDPMGIYFTLSSGSACTAYYYGANGDWQSSNYWFGCMVPQNGDEIHIYAYPEGENIYDYSFDYSDESELAEMVPCLCVLTFNGTSWEITEDYSND